MRTIEQKVVSYLEAGYTSAELIALAADHDVASADASSAYAEEFWSEEAEAARQAAALLDVGRAAEFLADV